MLLDCKVGDKGAMTGCQAASESPKGLGVGDLAVATWGFFKFIFSTLWSTTGLDRRHWAPRCASRWK